MNEVQIFNFEHANVRTVMIDYEPYFVGKDVAEILGYQKARNAIANHVEIEDKKDALIQGPLGGAQKMTVINESGVFDLILDAAKQSVNPEIKAKAKRFRHMVTAEILPSIRKTGGYMGDSFFQVEDQAVADRRIDIELNNKSMNAEARLINARTKEYVAETTRQQLEWDRALNISDPNLRQFMAEELAKKYFKASVTENQEA